ncbi:23S rRNA (guanosine(2251)-2'-O)-methyltransferase RlmB [bacterium]|nr:23S rRNA (guanosine(2251)-2'-O)-methyltransferase RlmB [bacterium]
MKNRNHADHYHHGQKKTKPGREYIYGINPVFEAVRAGRRHIYEAYINQASGTQQRIKKLADYLGRMNIPVNWVDKGRVLDLAGTKEHQGVVLKVKPYVYQNSELLWDRPRLLLLDNVEDPHNVGGILRSAEIFGFNTVLLSNKGVPDIYPSIVKVSAGATEFLDIAKDASANSYVKTAKEKGYRIVACDGSGTTDIHTIREKLAGKVMVVIGGEDRSVGQYILNTADFVVAIPQTGRINSLNASVAAGIALFMLQPKIPGTEE